MGKQWDYEGYWSTVLGANRTAEDIVREFELDVNDRRGLDEWLGTAEAEALATGNVGEVPTEWGDFHTRALDALLAVTE